MRGCAWDRLAWLGLVFAGALALGCNQFIGLEEVSLVDDGGVADAPVDGPVDAAVDAPVDAGPTNVYLFVTDTASSGLLGADADEARAVADARCEDKYNNDFTAKGCTNIHAFLQVDDDLDSLARMEINYGIPDDLEVLRAIDDTPVASSWDVVVDPNLALLAPVSNSGSPVPFWSGRGSVADRHCNSWTSESDMVFATSGDATVATDSWTAQGNNGCDNIDQRLLCVCF